MYRRSARASIPRWRTREAIPSSDSSMRSVRVVPSGSSWLLLVLSVRRGFRAVVNAQRAVYRAPQFRVRFAHVRERMLLDLYDQVLPND
jgi:hypothetical protein